MLAHPITPILLGFGLDLLLGDPLRLPHIVRTMGSLIALLEKVLWRKQATKAAHFIGGFCLVATVVATAYYVPLSILFAADRLSPLTGLAIRTLVCWQLIAVKDLRKQSMLVYHSLAQGDLPEARRWLSRIVGRDTAGLDCSGVTRAAVETVAENTSDGVVAPLFYLALGGVPLGCVYKAINTMDSMVGYKNERYLFFGRCAARLDDAANFLPARVAAALMLLGSALLGLDTKNAVNVFLRDRFCHQSPNSAQTEAVAAGALGVRLAGNATYFGKLVEKTFIGNDTRPIRPDDIKTINRLLYVTAVLALLTAVAGRVALGLF